MTSPLRRSACAPLALLLTIAGCATTTEPSDTVDNADVTGPEVYEHGNKGIPDWVRVIHPEPITTDRKTFGPGDIIPVVVVPEQPSVAGAAYLIRYTTNDPLNPAASLFEKVPSFYVTEPAEAAKAFAFALRVKPAAELPEDPVTVTVFLIGEKDGNTVRTPSNNFTVSR